MFVCAHSTQCLQEGAHQSDPEVALAPPLGAPQPILPQVHQIGARLLQFGVGAAQVDAGAHEDQGGDHRAERVQVQRTREEGEKHHVHALEQILTQTGQKIGQWEAYQGEAQ
jgi:hypothetical protein